MRMDRRLLYAGVFLVAVGGVLLAADASAVDTATLTDALRVWPLALVAVGAGLVLRRTSLGLAGGMVAAALPGLILGSALAVGPRFVGDCGAHGEPASTGTEQGTFDGPATVSVKAGCGSLTVRTAPGNGWQLAGGDTAGGTPIVRSSGRSLSIDSSADGWHVLDGGRYTWELTLPTTDIDDLSVVAFASDAQLALPGARIRSLALTADASRIVVDASEAAVADLSVVINVGSLSVALPANSDLAGSLRVGGGELRICKPTGLGLRVTTRGFASGVTVAGLHHAGSDWQSPDYPSAPHHADLSVRVNFGAVEIDPIGGCR